MAIVVDFKSPMGLTGFVKFKFVVAKGMDVTLVVFKVTSFPTKLYYQYSLTI